MTAFTCRRGRITPGNPLQLTVRKRRPHRIRKLLRWENARRGDGATGTALPA
jgi:hypothetical protein